MHAKNMYFTRVEYIQETSNYCKYTISIGFPDIVALNNWISVVIFKCKVDKFSRGF